MTCLKRQDVLVLFVSGEVKIFKQNVGIHQDAWGRRIAFHALLLQRSHWLALQYPGLDGLVWYQCDPYTLLETCPRQDILVTWSLWLTAFRWLIYKPEWQRKQNADYPSAKGLLELVVPSRSPNWLSASRMPFCSKFALAWVALQRSGVEEDWDSAQLECELWAPDCSPNAFSLCVIS